MHPDIRAYYERWDPEKLKKSQPVKAINKNYDPREARELNRSAYEAYLKRWEPEKLKKSQQKETAEDILNKFGGKPDKPKGRKPTGKKLTPQKVSQTLWVGSRGSTDIETRDVIISLDAKNKINRIAEILDKLNSKTSKGGYRYKKDIFESINEFEEAMSKFLREASEEEINQTMEAISWSGLNTDYGYNGNIKDFANELSKIASNFFNISLKQSAIGSDFYNF